MPASITMNIRHGDYAFGLRETDGWTLLFNESDCECCDATIMAANSIKAAISPSTAKRKLLSSMNVGESLEANTIPMLVYRPSEVNKMISVNGVLRTVLT